MNAAVAEWNAALPAGAGLPTFVTGGTGIIREVHWFGRVRPGEYQNLDYCVNPDTLGQVLGDIAIGVWGTGDCPDDGNSPADNAKSSFSDLKNGVAHELGHTLLGASHWSTSLQVDKCLMAITAADSFNTAVCRHELIAIE